MQVDPNGINVASRPKVTVPKELNLETALRAQRHKYMNYYSDYSSQWF